MVKSPRRASAAIVVSGLVPIFVSLAAAVWVSGHIVADAQTELQRYLQTLMMALLLMVTARFFILLWLGYLQRIESHLAPEPSIEGPAVTIVVPAYNEERVIQASIRSLLRLEYANYDIIVVDDGSTDATYARAVELEGCHDGVTVRVVTQANRGKARALNAGIALARTPFILCMDGDSVLAPGTLRYAMRHFADPRIGAVGGNVKVINRTNLWSRMQALEYVVGLNLSRRAQAFLRNVSIVPGPVGIFRRSALEAVGGYESDTYAEDTDLTLKLLAAGWQIEYEERSIAYTEAPERLLDLIKQRYRWSRGMLQAMLKREWAVAVPSPSVSSWLALQLMLFESVVWPLLDFFGNLAVVLLVLASGGTPYMVLWVALLTLFEIATTLHFVAMEREDLRLVPYALFGRFIYGTLLEVVKLLAMGEEFARVRMTWGKLERLGRIEQHA